MASLAFIQSLFIGVMPLTALLKNKAVMLDKSPSLKIRLEILPLASNLCRTTPLTPDARTKGVYQRLSN